MLASILEGLHGRILLAVDQTAQVSSRNTSHKVKHAQSYAITYLV